MKLSIRSATRNDALHVAAIVDIAGHGIDLDSWMQDRGPDHAVLDSARRAAFAYPDCRYHFSCASLIESDGEVAGGLVGGLLTGEETDPVEPGSPAEPLIALENRLPGYWSILAIAVYPEFRGKGLARRLLDHARHLAVASGAKGISLVVEASNRPAIALYGKMGFTEAERRPWIAYGGRTGPNEWVMMTAGIDSRS